jgi:PadR family transcriptional regulator
MPRMSRQPNSSGHAELLPGKAGHADFQGPGPPAICGHAILQRIQQLSRDALQIRQESLYPVLYRWEERGWLESDWQAPKLGNAKFSTVTKLGRRQLEAEKGGWQRLCQAPSLRLLKPEIRGAET